MCHCQLVCQTSLVGNTNSPLTFRRGKSPHLLVCLHGTSLIKLSRYSSLVQISVSLSDIPCRQFQLSIDFQERKKSSFTCLSAWDFTEGCQGVRQLRSYRCIYWWRHPSVSVSGSFERSWVYNGGIWGVGGVRGSIRGAPGTPLYIPEVPNASLY